MQANPYTSLTPPPSSYKCASLYSCNNKSPFAPHKKSPPATIQQPRIIIY